MALQVEIEREEERRRRKKKLERKDYAGEKRDENGG